MKDTENTDLQPESDDPSSLGSSGTSTPEGDSETPQETYVIPPLPKIDEAMRGEDQGIEIDAPSAVGETLVAEQEMGESKMRQIFRKIIRWTAGLLIVFGLGLITGIYLFYKPATQEAERMLNELKVHLDEANSKIADLEALKSKLEAQISDLEPYEAMNDELMAQQKDLNLHIAILEARIDITHALLAIEGEDLLQAQFSLDETEAALDQIGSFLDKEKQEVVDELKTQLQWIKDDLEKNPVAAQKDLEALEAKLLQMEDDLTQ